MLPIITTIFFGIIAIALSIKDDRQKKAVLQKENKQDKQLHQLSVLKEIQERIGYELDIERVAEVITESIKNLLQYSTISSLILKENSLILNTHIETEVSHAFLAQVKTNMLASFSAILGENIPTEVKEYITGEAFDDNNNLPPSSYFHIPLIINNKVVGLINISSTVPGIYKEEEMTILYQIIYHVSGSLSNLQQVLRNEKEKLLAMIRSLADGVFMVDKNNQLLIINPAAQKFLDIEKPDLSILDLQNAFRGSFDLATKLEESIIKRKTVEEKEVIIGKRTVQIIINPVLDVHTNAVIGASVLLNDITLEKNLAKIKEDFTHMIVHELRTPLTAMKGASEIMEKSADTLNHQEQTKLLKIINQQSERLLDEISSLLDAAKLEAGKFTIAKKPTNITELIEQRLAFFKPQLQIKNLQLATDIDHSFPIVNIDEFRIGQVINNLLSNSIKFTPEGGRITVKVAKAESSSDASFVVVSVSDTGIGIPKEKQSLLFNKFGQAGQTVTNANGTGLGLFIAKGIVEAHGGRINLQSEEGKGTTVTVILPIPQQPKTEEIPLPQQAYCPPSSSHFQTAAN